MSRRKATSPGTPKDAYLISFGDTMTALLAFFIVLNSLATEQTGMNFYSGTGSFIRATDTLGVPGIFRDGRSRHPVQLNESSPLYIVEDENRSGDHGDGPDADNDSLLIRDREQEDFERLLNELERLHSPSQRQNIAGEFIFDRHQSLSTQPPLLDAPLRQLLIELRPRLLSGEVQAEIVVWTPTPSPSAWERSTRKAAAITEESKSYLHLDQSLSESILGSSRQWNSSTLDRPVLSVIVRKVEK